MFAEYQIYSYLYLSLFQFILINNKKTTITQPISQNKEYK